MKVRPKFTVNGFRTDARGTERVLGRLESAVIELLWLEPHLTVVEVTRRLERRREIALTTVLTVLDRMYRKGYLIREKEGKAYLYSPRYSRPEFEAGMIREILSSLLIEAKEATLIEFISIIADDSETLHRLEEIIRMKRLEQAK